MIDLNRLYEPPGLDLTTQIKSAERRPFQILIAVEILVASLAMMRFGFKAMGPSVALIASVVDASLRWGFANATMLAANLVLFALTLFLWIALGLGWI